MPSKPARPVGLLRLARDRLAEGLDHLAEIVAVTQHAKVRVALHPVDVLPPGGDGLASSRTDRSA